MSTPYGARPNSLPTTGGREAVGDEGVPRLAVVEDHPLYRAALVGVLEAGGRFTISAAVGSLREFEMRVLPRDTIVLLDLGLPGISGVDAVTRTVERGYPVLVLSARSERTTVLACIHAGARGYLTKEAEADEIGRAISEVARGRGYVAPNLASALLTRGTTAGVERPPLSQREREVLALLAAGERDQDIARKLSISIRTVRTHLDRIRDKSGHRRRPDLTRLAFEEGIAGPNPSDVPTTYRR